MRHCSSSISWPASSAWRTSPDSPERLGGLVADRHRDGGAPVVRFSSGARRVRRRFLVNVTTAGSIPSSLGVALGNTLEAVLAVWLVDRFAGGRQAFRSAAGILEFAGLAAFVSTMVSATIGVASLTLGGYAAVEDWREIWFTWWLGDAAGAVLIAPLAVLWWTSRPWDRPPQKLRGAALLFTAIVAIGALTFFHPALARYPLAVSLFGAARLGRVAVRASHARDGRGVARDRRDGGYGDRPRHIRDVDAERIAARIAGIPHHDGHDGAADGRAHRRASRVIRERARRASGCGCGVPRQGSVPRRVEPRAAQSAGGYQHRGRRAGDGPAHAERSSHGWSRASGVNRNTSPVSSTTCSTSAG